MYIYILYAYICIPVFCLLRKQKHVFPFCFQGRRIKFDYHIADILGIGWRIQPVLIECLWQVFEHLVNLEIGWLLRGRVTVSAFWRWRVVMCLFDTNRVGVLWDFCRMRCVHWNSAIVWRLWYCFCDLHSTDLLGKKFWSTNELTWNQQLIRWLSMSRFSSILLNGPFEYPNGDLSVSYKMEIFLCHTRPQASSAGTFLYIITLHRLIDLNFRD